jgi:hypothetical protein
LVATRVLPEEQAGLYAGAASVARLVAMTVQPVLLVLFSRLATEHAAQIDTSATLRLGGSLVVTGLAVSMLVPLFGGELLLRSYLGEAYVAAQPVLVYLWATACVLAVQVFAAESLLATTGLRGGAVFAVPAVGLGVALAYSHGSAVAIARTALTTTATLGTLACVSLWLAARGRRASTARRGSARPAGADE